VKKFKWYFVVLGLLILVGGAFLGWGLTPLGPSESAQDALISDTTILVNEGEFIEFIPQSRQTQTGLIIYPGGRVDWRSYAPLARAISAQGYFVAITPMPLSLAVLAPGRAENVISAHPEIAYWAVGGHSLGGAMAANFAYKNPRAVKGLILWAAYPPSNNNLSSYSIKVISISASQDGLATKEKIDAARNLLPADTHWVVIQGGNHAQFGSYGIQPGDETASISPSEQMSQIVDATTALLTDLQE
jgi:hypothetical protein